MITYLKRNKIKEKIVDDKFDKFMRKINNKVNT